MPFRFLDLPAELRVMVYQQLDMDTYHRRLEDPVMKQLHPDKPSSFITLVVNALPVSVLLVSRFVHVEALPVLNSMLEQLRLEPIHFIVDSSSWKVFGQVSLFISWYMHANVDNVDLHDRNAIPDNLIRCWFGFRFVSLFEFIVDCVQYIYLWPGKSTIITLRSHIVKGTFDIGIFCWILKIHYAECTLGIQMIGFNDTEVQAVRNSVQSCRNNEPNVFNHLTIQSVAAARWNDIWEHNRVVDYTGIHEIPLKTSRGPKRMISRSFQEDKETMIDR